ncbi:uncharacterized protein LOC125032702 [Penaeus chinensis]|uniref:uncharacterized protein LOC125032702 n=1 Tax=Penaeus chinensis TaxID=139456 RepID=UPI001FB7A8C3|nr:uncharacterized protein LOC125032702 [Penaeus chinensis]
MRVVQGCVLITVFVVPALNLVSAAHSTPISAPLDWRRQYSPRPLQEDGVVEYSERRAEQFSLGSAKQFPLEGSEYFASATDFPSVARERHSLSSAIGTRHLGSSQFSRGFLDPPRRLASVGVIGAPDDGSKAELCWGFPFMCPAPSEQFALHLPPAGGESRGRRTQASRPLQGDRPRPAKRYLGIELPDYIATKHTALRATNSHYLARINQLKQRMRHVGK